jgi:Photosynthetic reaction centre cytochrome C subunit
MTRKLTGLRFSGSAIGLAVGAVLIAIAFVGLTGARGQSTPQETFAKGNDVRPAEQVYKNIQALKGMPAKDVLDLMKTFTHALGVRCEFCHVTAEGSDIPGFGAFSKDDLEMKRTARKMILMVASIKTNFFDGTDSPTCWTCHRGSKKPELVPPPVPPAQPLGGAER